ncbi:hypothetical protein CVD19_02290 [Bacillus sp. T33-2]|nr:hypothetical protein CVD19_02290 [Bacillus sp. T33-2]
MKRVAVLLLTGILTVGVASGCGSGNEKEAIKLDPKHAAMADFVLDSSPIVQETYLMAAEKPEVLASVPCFCSCGESAGHMSNLDCFVKGMGPDNAVTEWDPHGIS